MKILSRVLRVVIASVALGATTFAAESTGPVFRERFAGVFASDSRTYYSLQTMQGEQFGGQQPYSGVGVSHFFDSIDDAVTLLNGQLLFNNNGNPAGTFGGQQRWLVDLPVIDTSILGAGLYFDFSQSAAGNQFQQANINVECFTESAWVGRANGYFPIGQRQASTGPLVGQGGAPGQLSLVGTAVGFGGFTRQQLDVALMGGEFELGRKFFGYRMEAYAGYYNWSGPIAGFTNGAKGGLRGFITDGLWGNINVSHDQFFGTSVYGGVTYTFGSRGGRRPQAFENLMTLPVERAMQVAVGNFTQVVSNFQPARDAISGDPLHAFFVAEGATGAGTQGAPSNVNAVLGNPQFGHGSAMILLDENGSITPPVALTQDRQQLLGGGSTGTAEVDFSQAMGQPPGTTVVHLSNLGGRPVLAPASGNAVTLTNQNVVQGFAISGLSGTTNGIAGHPGAIDTTIRDMVISDLAGTGIIIQPSTRTTIDHVTFANNGSDVLLNAADSTITDITSTGALHGSLNLGGGAGDITGNTTISNVSITGAGGFGGILLNNAQTGATINLTDVSVADGSGAGVTITNSNVGSLYTLTDVNVLNVGADGLALTDAGQVNIQGGSIQGTAGSGIRSVNTDLSASSVMIGTAGEIVGDGITIVNNSGSHFVQLTGNTITGTTGGVRSSDSGLAGGLILSLDGNTYQSTGVGSHALNVTGSTLNSTIIQSMNGGTVIGGSTSGGLLFDQVTFDSSGADLSGTQVNAGYWQVGTTGTHLQGDGVRLDSASGSLNFGSLYIFNNNGTGLSADTTPQATTFTLGTGGGRIDSTSGSALFLDTLAAAVKFDDVSSRNSGSTGITLDTVSGSVNLRGTAANAAVSDVRIVNSSATTSMNLSLTTNGNTAVILDGNSGPVSISSFHFQRAAGDILFDIDRSVASTGPITISGAVADGAGTAFRIGAGARDIDVQGHVTSTGTTTDPVIEIIGQSGGTINFDTVNIVDATSTNAVLTTGQSGGVVHFHSLSVTGFGNAATDTAVSLNGTGGSALFDSFGIKTSNGAGLEVGSITYGASSGASINATGGTALVMNGTTVNGGLVGISVFGNGGVHAIDLANVIGTTYFGGSSIKNTIGDAIVLNNADTVQVMNNTLLNGIGGNGITSTNTNLVVDKFSTAGFMAGDAIAFQNTDAVDRSVTVTNFVSNSPLQIGGRGIVIDSSGIGIVTANLSQDRVQSTGTALQMTESSATPAANRLRLNLGPATSWQSASNVFAIDLTGQNIDPDSSSLVVTSFGPSTGQGGSVNSTNAVGGGIHFSNVGFDSDLNTAGNQQVVAAKWQIGTMGEQSRIQGDGVRFDAPTGDLNFSADISNSFGTGLYVDTKTVGTNFHLANAGGYINTKNGAAMYLDPLSADLTFLSVTSTGTVGNAIDLVGITGTVTINGGLVNGDAHATAPGSTLYSAINVDNSALTGADTFTLNLNNMTIAGAPAAPGITLLGQSALNPILLNLNNTSVQGGDIPGLGTTANRGGGAGIQPAYATITLNATSTVTGGRGGFYEGGGAGIGGSASFGSLNLGPEVTVNNAGVIRGGAGEAVGTGGNGGGGAGVGGAGGGSAFSNGGAGNNAVVYGTGMIYGGRGQNGGGGAAVGGGGGGIGNLVFGNIELGPIQVGSGGDGNSNTISGSLTLTGGSSTSGGGGAGAGGGGATGLSGGAGVRRGGDGLNTSITSSGVTVTGGSALGSDGGGGGAGVGGGGGGFAGNGGNGNGASNAGIATGGPGFPGTGGGGAGVGGGGGGGNNSGGNGGAGGDGLNASNSGQATGGSTLVNGHLGGGGAGAGVGGGGGGQFHGPGGSGAGATNTGTATGGNLGGASVGNGRNGG